ncbi:NACHT domain-containing protein [Streptomyces sp. MUM 178J]|uniref:NACHT domain-containing protein n=1 Tax=Streptomyces sp. MUM 178J TaxID=2791991 RepID=UPI001F03A406|nr:NACHT domain-containing protein [Streptomyces sp. MUM 178J]WRQ78774.1 NACHT domain-containing protein [Streptomyces sp. MUM 178J]
MQSLEVVIARLAGTVLGTAVKPLLAPRPGAGLVDRPLRPLPRPASPDRLAKTLSARLSESYAALPEHERLAAVDAVRDSFAAAGAIDADRLFRLDLDPERLRGELHSPAAGLSARALDLYEELLSLCCAHVVEQLTAHPSFPARAAVEQTRTAGRTQALVEGLARRRPEAAALEFEQRYADYIAATHGRLELFGLTLGRSASEWPLDTAYISLSVSDREGPGLPDGAVRVAVGAEQALTESDRVLLRGPAGSGKSTLVQWLALNAARRTFPVELADWNRCVPFVLRLRAFTSSEALPLPDDFLRAAGVPLHGSAPGGWVDALMSSGRAAVLIDGVDEVPARLRHRTETWLKSLIAAFPEARYVVTTRPSAVPEDWLASQGFAPRSLLPMDRRDIRAFIAHWHDTARRENPSDTELLDTYEKSLVQAVTTRRDLGRLATNPLMCALLCALNRDRRMHLPRARKELYDAALDMLLVRRDMEREIGCVEGVSLTRDEQTALLQRLAYWLIRNGQVEASRPEAVEMLDEWLAAMPQVTAGPEDVFAHLLIRSGLLREPMPGAVDFVHRTFQDYLGAKAAVEARDFGVLVKNAHDDQWDDVVRMAVGHARVEERTRLLRQILRRADRAPRLRNRLVLLAAACLEHAPELDPEVRKEVESRTAELVPPRSIEEAEELAKAGELVLELLPGPEGLEEETAGAVVRTAASFEGDAALAVITRFKEDNRLAVAGQISHAWSSFETEPYARDVLAAGAWDGSYLHISTPEQLRSVRHVPHARRVHLSGPHADLTPLLAVRDPEQLFVYDNRELTDLSPLRALPQLRDIGLSYCPEVRDLTPLARPRVERLTLVNLHPDVDVRALDSMPDLRELVLNHPLLIESVGELPIGAHLTRLLLFEQMRYVSLEGVERWPGLTSLGLSGLTQLRQLSRTPSLSGLRRLTLVHADPRALQLLCGLTRLQLLTLQFCGLPEDLSPLRALRSLTELHLWRCSPAGSAVDLAPLADLEQLTIHATADTPLTGLEPFAPGRIVIH